jgi:hypothetical protein
MKKGFKYIRIILLVFGSIIGIILFIFSIMLILNHYFQFSPDKISAEFETSIMYSSISLIFSIIFLLLVYGLLKYKKWFIKLLWLTFVLYVIPVVNDVIFKSYLKNVYEDTLFILLGIIFPCSICIYLTVNDELFKA